MCLLLLALIFILVRHTGHAIYKTRLQRGWRRLTWVPLFLLLFCFSGYGFLNSSMLIFVGPDIARDDVSNLLTDIAQLKTQAANSVTHVPDYAAYNTLVTAIANDRNQLQSEIRNRAGGNTCGIASGAKALINTINGLVSGHNLAIHMLTGLSATHSCADKKQIDTIGTAYDGQIKGILDKLAEQFGVANRQKTEDEISAALKDDEAALKAVNDSLSGVENFAFNLSIYQASSRDRKGEPRLQRTACPIARAVNQTSGRRATRAARIRPRPSGRHVVAKGPDRNVPSAYFRAWMRCSGRMGHFHRL